MQKSRKDLHIDGRVFIIQSEEGTMLCHSPRIYPG